MWLTQPIVTLVGLIIIQKDLNNISLLRIYMYIYMTFTLIIYIYNDLPNLMQVIMYCYIHLRCICCYYTCIPAWQIVTCVFQSGDMYISAKADRTAQLGIYMYIYIRIKNLLFKSFCGIINPTLCTFMNKLRQLYMSLSLYIVNLNIKLLSSSTYLTMKYS